MKKYYTKAMKYSNGMWVNALMLFICHIVHIMPNWTDCKVTNNYVNKQVFRTK